MESIKLQIRPFHHDEQHIKQENQFEQYLLTEHWRKDYRVLHRKTRYFEIITSSVIPSDEEEEEEKDSPPKFLVLILKPKDSKAFFSKHFPAHEDPSRKVVEISLQNDDFLYHPDLSEKTECHWFSSCTIPSTVMKALNSDQGHSENHQCTEISKEEEEGEEAEPNIKEEVFPSIDQLELIEQCLKQEKISLHDEEEDFTMEELDDIVEKALHQHQQQQEKSGGADDLTEEDLLLIEEMLARENSPVGKKRKSQHLLLAPPQLMTSNFSNNNQSSGDTERDPPLLLNTLSILKKQEPTTSMSQKARIFFQGKSPIFLKNRQSREMLSHKDNYRYPLIQLIDHLISPCLSTFLEYFTSSSSNQLNKGDPNFYIPIFFRCFHDASRLQDRGEKLLSYYLLDRSTTTANMIIKPPDTTNKLKRYRDDEEDDTIQRVEQQQRQKDIHRFLALHYKAIQDIISLVVSSIVKDFALSKPIGPRRPFGSSVLISREEHQKNKLVVILSFLSITIGTYPTEGYVFSLLIVDLHECPLKIRKVQITSLDVLIRIFFHPKETISMKMVRKILLKEEKEEEEDKALLEEEEGDSGHISFILFNTCPTCYCLMEGDIIKDCLASIQGSDQVNFYKKMHEYLDTLLII